MTTDDEIINEKLQLDINREGEKIWALPSSKTDKYDFLTSEEILPSDQSRIIEQGKFTCDSLSKTFAKQIKSLEDQGKNKLKL